MTKIGFVGLGVMGNQMAGNLLRAGFSLSVFNRTREKCRPLIAKGAFGDESPQQLAAQSDVVITMLADTTAVAEALFGAKGIALGLRPETIVIDMSTISPRSSIDFANRIQAVARGMLDAPVSGGEKGAADGTLGIMVGGDRELFDKCHSIFQAMGKTITYTGPSGNGQKTKLVNQLVGATNLLAMVEGMRLAVAGGLDPEVTLEAISSGAASSWMLANLGPRILKGDFSPGFSIKLQFKDLELLKQWMSDLDEDFPAASLAHTLFGKAVEMGLESQGNQGLINVWSNK